MHWKVYLVRCSDKSLYCGITNDVTSRMEKHNGGQGAKYTKSHLPVKLMAVSRGLSKSDALALERYIKRKPAGEKIAALYEKEVRSQHSTNAKCCCGTNVAY